MIEENSAAADVTEPTVRQRTTALAAGLEGAAETIRKAFRPFNEALGGDGSNRG